MPHVPSDTARFVLQLKHWVREPWIGPGIPPLENDVRWVYSADGPPHAGTRQVCSDTKRGRSSPSSSRMEGFFFS